MYKMIILLVVYGCKTWSHKVREECRLKVTVNEAQMRIAGPKRK